MVKCIRNAGVLLICLCILVSLSACDFGTQGDNRLLARVVTVNAKALEAPTYGKQDTRVGATANGANDFAFRLSAALMENVGSENFVCSPYSVWLPLAALVNATDAKDRGTLLSALGVSGIAESDLNKAASRMLYDLMKLRDKENPELYHNPLQIANAIFVGLDVTLRNDFAQTFMDYYRGSSINVDFTSRVAVDAVNQWASENTEGLIDNLIQGFDPETVAVIANAIYFSDRWQWEFDPDQTTEDTFHAPAGDTTAFYMLREGNSQDYYEDDRVQAMPLRFKTGGCMYILLPKTGDAVQLLSSMTNDYFDEIQTNSISATGKLLLPRFSIENEINGLKEALELLGVSLFDSNSAVLTGGLIEEDIPVWLSGAIQKAVIHVDEEGTTAAAVTILPAPGAMPPQPTEPFEMNCNRPFVFILCERTYDGGNQILFTGVVNQP